MKQKSNRVNKIALNNSRPITIKQLINQVNKMQPKKFRKNICEDAYIFLK